MQPYQVLLIENEDATAGFIEHTLARDDIQVTLMSGVRPAEAFLQQHPGASDAIILDHDLPEGDSLTFIRSLKQQQGFRHIPVIMITAESDQHSILQGIDAGAYYYLHKPLEQTLLAPVISEAIRQYREICVLHNTVQETHQALHLLNAAEFRLQTVAEAHLLTHTLSLLFPDPERVRPGLLELLINAIEHGNLGISHDHKTQLLMQRQWHTELKKRSLDPVLAERSVSVQFQRLPNRLQLTIQDQGEGFNWRPYLAIDPERVFHLHGRGIAIAQRISFDQLEYSGCGNCVTAAVGL